MRDHEFSRRGVLAGALATVPLAAVAADKKPPEKAPKPEEPKLFTTGPMAQNDLASMFAIPQPPLVWPNKGTLLGKGKQKTSIEAYRGKVLIVSLWAEWCTPCMIEMPGFTVLQEHIKGTNVEIVPILTSSNEFYRPEDALPLLGKIGASKLNFLMDGAIDRLPRALAWDQEHRSPVLPCTLILDAEGRIRGRLVGSSVVEDSKGVKYSIWATNIALQMIQGLANGALG